MAETTRNQSSYKEDVLNLISRFAEFGATAEGGIWRLAASKEDKDARDFLCTWFEQNGLATLIDEVGNIFGVLELDSSQDDTSFFCGSHLDSQPHGGRLDGALGVAYACASALALKEARAQKTLKSAYRRFVVSCWTSEEGARFQPSLLGSRVFVGQLPTERALNSQDADGISLEQALSDIGYLGGDTIPKADRYVEVHIEQGVELEDADEGVGLVSSAWGARKLTLSCLGRADHTGPTPMDARKDALLAASHLVIAINDIACSTDLKLHSSVGRIEVSPNSPNTLTDEANLWIEFRAADEDVLDRAEEQFSAVAASVAQKTGCIVNEISREARPVIQFDKESVNSAAGALEAEGISYLNMTTISGHDALQLQSVCPSTLMFVPSKDGISHAPEESTSNEDIARGFDAALAVISALVATPATVKGACHD